MAAIILAACMVAMAAAGQTSSGPPGSCSAYASVPLPPETESVPVPTTPPGCASYRSYRGIGRAVNYSSARACAWRERLASQASLGQNAKDPTAWVVGGSLILADIYFNGAGVTRNVPLAIRFACESEEGMAELALPDIAKGSASRHAGGRFEFCDYASSTFQMNFCGGYASEIEDDRRSRYYRSLKSAMTPPQQEAFQRLLIAEKAYIREHSLEVDQGGTIRTIRTLGSDDILEDLFRTEVVHFERKRWPALTADQIRSADAALRSEYQKKRNQLHAQSTDEIDAGAVTAEHLTSAERAWTAYRDAWVAFAQLRYPGEVMQIRAELTLRRYRLLKTITAYQ